MAEKRVATYTGCVDEQVSFGGHDDPRGVLEVGKEYEVERMVVHSMHTRTYLKDFPDKDFNSVCFDGAEPTPEELDAFWIRKTGKPRPAKATPDISDLIAVDNDAKATEEEND